MSFNKLCKGQPLEGEGGFTVTSLMSEMCPECPPIEPNQNIDNTNNNIDNPNNQQAIENNTNNGNINIVICLG